MTSLILAQLKVLITNISIIEKKRKCNILLVFSPLSGTKVRLRCRLSHIFRNSIKFIYLEDSTQAAGTAA